MRRAMVTVPVIPAKNEVMTAINDVPAVFCVRDMENTRPSPKPVRVVRKNL